MNPEASRSIGDEPCHCGSGHEHHTDVHRPATEAHPSTNYTQKTRAAEAFLTGRGIPDEDVLGFDVAKEGVRLHIYGSPLSGVTWKTKRVGHNDHHEATVMQDGVALNLVTVTRAVVAA